MHLRRFRPCIKCFPSARSPDPLSFGPSKILSILRGWCVEGPAGCAPNGALIAANGARTSRSSEIHPPATRPKTRRPRKYRQGRQNCAIASFPRPPEHGTSRDPMGPDQLTSTDQMLDVSHCCRGQRGLWASPRPSEPPSAPILGRSGRAREHQLPTARPAVTRVRTSRRAF